MVQSLNWPSHYKAVSYTWGSTHQYSLLCCRERAIAVTENLLSAIKALRQAEVIVHLWIDQVRINQADDVERARRTSEAVRRNLCKELGVCIFGFQTLLETIISSLNP